MYDLQNVPTAHLEEELIRRYKTELWEDSHRNWDDKEHIRNANDRFEDFDEELCFLHGSIKAKREHRLTCSTWLTAASVVPCWIYALQGNIWTILLCSLIHIATVFFVCLVVPSFFPMVFPLDNLYYSRPSRKYMLSMNITLVVITILLILCVYYRS